MCTRVLWSSGAAPGEGNVLVGRSMDWYEDTRTVLAHRPRGAARSSAPNDPLGWEWTSTYGSVVALMYGKIPVEGMNEVGFQAAGLYLSESDYGERDASRPQLSLVSAIQFFLDSFETVTAAVSWLRGHDPQIVAVKLGNHPGTAHISLADSSGDSAIVEYLSGETRISHGSEHTIMANSPAYEEQLARLSAFTGLGGEAPLPGGTDSPDRFARAAYYAAHLPESTDERESIAQVLSVVRNASAPFGTADPVRPNISTTLWRTVSDLTHLVYYFESSYAPNIVWTRFSELNFDSGPERVLDLTASVDRVGDVSAQYV